MQIVSYALLMISGVFFALGNIHLRFWLTERARLDYLAFTISCFSYMVFSWGEMGMMHSATPEEYLFYAWWSFFPGTVALISTAWFAYLYLRGRRWLFVTYSALRILAFILHLFMANGINFREITSVGQVTLLGETFSYPIAVPNLWMVIPHLSHVLLVIYFLDASVRCWRRGERHQALTFGTGTILFGATVLLVSVSVLWGLAPIPLIVSFAGLFIVAPMLYELNYNMHQTAMFAGKLVERETELEETLQQLNLSAGAANVGMWMRKEGGKEIWASDKMREILGFPLSHHITREEFLQKVHPDDRELAQVATTDFEPEKNEFQIEFRVLPKNGDVRWVDARGKIELINGNKKVVRGAAVDITMRKKAEEAIHDLSRRLMNAQEKERARLARELHDDLSQSLALLSIQLSELRSRIPESSELARDQIDHLVIEIERLSADVHRISYELHPAKLNQLGLESALSRLCRELAASHSLDIEFESKEVPRSLSDDISLCLYRIVQESLQNVIKHSGASAAKVSIKLENSKIRLTVIDNGSGFDTDAAKSRESLGLISIDERVRGVNGTSHIVSLRGMGTRIEIRIPLNMKIQ